MFIYQISGTWKRKNEPMKSNKENIYFDENLGYIGRADTCKTEIRCKQHKDKSAQVMISLDCELDLILKCQEK